MGKERLIRLLRMLVIKFNLRNRSWVIRMNKKIKIIMQVIRKKMTLKWKMILMEKCIQSNRSRKVRVKMMESLKKWMKKWVQLMIKRSNKI